MRAGYEARKPTRNLVVSMILISLALAFHMLGFLTQPVAALPAGFQEFYLPLPTGNTTPLSGTYSIFNAIEPPIDATRGMHYVVGVTASADNTVVYYDHWENGYGTGTTSDQTVYLNKGQVHYFESSNVPVPRGTVTKYDGGDRIFVSGSLLQLVVSTWTEHQGTVFTDAWEVYPVQAWQNAYSIPVGENLATAPTNYRDFSYVFALVMSAVDGNSIVIVDPAGAGLNRTLNRGQTAIYQVKGAGTTVTASGKVQVQLITGRRDTSGWEMRGYTLTPRSYWGSGYYSPVPSWSNGARSELYLYNPNNSTITINFEDRNGTGSFTIAAGATRSYSSGAGRYIPVGSGAYVYAPSGALFWGIGSADSGSATWDWGYDLIPTNFLGTDNYVSWAPGTRDRSANGSPVFVTAMQNNTTVFVDYGPNDGVLDASYKINRLQTIKIYGRNNDNTGMHIVSTAPVAVAWGQDPDKAGTGDPYLDMGYTTLPLPIEWIDVALQVEKTANPTQIYINQQSQFTIVVSVPSSAGAAVTGIDLVDRLAPGWAYVAGSGSPSDPTTITGNLTTGYVLTWASNWTINPGGSRNVTFNASATDSADISNPNRNVATAIGRSLGATLNADDDAFVDVLRLVQSPQVQATKTDSLFIDADGDSVPSPGDTLKYDITVTNKGNGVATGVVFTDTPDINTKLVAGSVDVTGSPGAYVTSGNNPGDTAVGVNIGAFAPGATAQITFLVTIGSDGFNTVANQGSVAGTNFTTVLTDDPDTSAPNDPTITPVTVGPPVLTITKLGPSQAQVGSVITYTGTLTNISQSTARNVILVDQVPAGMTFVSSSHTAVYNATANTITWYLGNVGPGVSIPGWVALHVSDTVPNNTLLTNIFSLTWDTSPSPATASCNTTIYTHSQLTLDKQGPTAAIPSQTFNYTLSIGNSGGTAAQNVTLRDTLPTYLTYLSSNPSGTYAAGPRTVTWGLGTIPPGSSVTVTLMVRVNPTVPNETDVVNTATVVWRDDGTTYGPVPAEWHTIVYTQPKLTITKSGPDRAMVDSTITYNGILSNVGGSTAHNATLVDNLPPSATFIDSSHAVYDIESNTVTWYLGDLPSGASVPGWLTVHIALNTPDGTVLTNTFSVTAQDSLGNPVEPATASWNTVAHTRPVLTIDKTGPDTAYPNSTVQYSIKVTNIGGCDAFNVTIVDDLPIGFSYISSTPAGIHLDGIVMWNLGSIPASESVEISVSATADRGFPSKTLLINTTGVLWDDSLQRRYGPVYNTAETTVYASAQASGAAVGMHVYPINKLVVMAPWLLLALALVGAVIVIVRYSASGSK